jgi:hypothetical protein
MQLRYLKSEQGRPKKDQFNIRLIFMLFIGLLDFEFYEQQITPSNYVKYHFWEPKIPCWGHLMCIGNVAA